MTVLTEAACACGRSVSSRGMCSRCYRQWWADPANAGQIRRYGLDELERLLQHVDVGLCWMWTGSTDDEGYGLFRSGGSPLAHRRCWELLVGPIPDGLVLDHLCRVRACVNPDHLEPVTQLENVRRGANRPRLTCPAGHPREQWGGERCGTCRRAYMRNYMRNYRKETANA